MAAGLRRALGRLQRRSARVRLARRIRAAQASLGAACERLVRSGDLSHPALEQFLADIDDLRRQEALIETDASPSVREPAEPSSSVEPPSAPSEDADVTEDGGGGVTEGPPLTAVKGVGPTYARRLAAGGVTTPADLAAMPLDELAALLETTEPRAAKIRSAAAELTSDKEEG